jgi:hypothetical protein
MNPTQNTAPTGHTALLEKSAAAIASQYRALVALQGRSAPGARWMFGAELRLLKNAFYIAKEAEGVRAS